MAIQDWFGVSQMVPCSWTCGYCGLAVGGNMGFFKDNGKAATRLKEYGITPGLPSMLMNPHQLEVARIPADEIDASLTRIFICPQCDKPTFFDGGKQIPGMAFGAEVGHLPGHVSDLYKEARNCMAVSAFTASVLATRKLLMNVAVTVGAKQNGSFQEYVTYLASNGYVPPNAKGWVDHIRKKGNERNSRNTSHRRIRREGLAYFHGNDSQTDL